MSGYAGKTMAYYFKRCGTSDRTERNTPIFATSAAAAKKQLRRPSPDEACVSSVRTPKPGEGRTKDGKKVWSRVRSDGSSPGKSGASKRGYGPPLK